MRPMRARKKNSLEQFIQAVRDTAMEAIKATVFKRHPWKKKHSDFVLTKER